MFGDFLKKRRAQRLGVYRCFSKLMIKILYKTEHNETQQKHKISQSPSNKWPLKSHDVPTAQRLPWFCEKQVVSDPAPRHGFLSLRTRIGSILAPFCDRGKTEKEPKSDQVPREEHFAPSKNGHWSGFGKQSRMHWGMCDICTFGKGETMLKCGRETKIKVFMVLA